MNDYLFCLYVSTNDARARQYVGYGYAPDFIVDEIINKVDKVLGMGTVGGRKEGKEWN